MALMVCPECGKEVSDRATSCPNCGYPIDTSQPPSGDTNQKMKNLYDRARKSLEVGDLKHAAEYYKELLDSNPDDWEAYFYSYLGEMTTFTNAQASNVASKLGKTIPTAYDMAVKCDDPAEIAKRVKLISKKTAERILLIGLTAKSLLKNYEEGDLLSPEGKVKRNLYNNLRPTAANTVVCCSIALTPLVDKVEAIYKDGKINEETRKESLLALLQTKLAVANMTFKPALNKTEKLTNIEYIQKCARQIKEIDPNFKEPDLSTDSNGCYIATAVYGSYDCPQVWTLRRYRDYELASTWYGRTFIRTYYAISPTLVNWFGKTAWFKKLWLKKLDRIISKLKEKGVEDSPYDDLQW